MGRPVGRFPEETPTTKGLGKATCMVSIGRGPDGGETGGPTRRRVRGSCLVSPVVVTPT